MLFLERAGDLATEIPCGARAFAEITSFGNSMWFILVALATLAGTV